MSKSLRTNSLLRLAHKYGHPQPSQDPAARDCIDGVKLLHREHLHDLQSDRANKFIWNFVCCLCGLPQGHSIVDSTEIVIHNSEWIDIVPV
jgi:hypothetical protein